MNKEPVYVNCVAHGRRTAELLINGKYVCHPCMTDQCVQCVKGIGHTIAAPLGLKVEGLQTPTPQSWEEEFDNKFGGHMFQPLSKDQLKGGAIIKAFIAKQIARAEEKGWYEGNLKGLDEGRKLCDAEVEIKVPETEKRGEQKGLNRTIASWEQDVKQARAEGKEEGLGHRINFGDDGYAKAIEAATLNSVRELIKKLDSQREHHDVYAEILKELEQ